MKLADEYGETNLEKDCTRIIKTKLTMSNVLSVKEMAERFYKKVTGAVSIFLFFFYYFFSKIYSK